MLMRHSHNAANESQGEHEMSTIAFHDTVGAKNLMMQFANGYELSISKGPGNYSGHNTAEIAVFRDGKFVRIEGQFDDVIGWVSADTVASVAYFVSLGDLDAVRDILDVHSLTHEGSDALREGVARDVLARASTGEGR
jgi:hypothetical protein